MSSKSFNVFTNFGPPIGLWFKRNIPKMQTKYQDLYRIGQIFAYVIIVFQATDVTDFKVMSSSWFEPPMSVNIPTLL